MSRARAERFLRAFWGGSDLCLAPYDRPKPAAPPVATPPPASKPAARPVAAAAAAAGGMSDERLDALLGIRPVTEPPKKKRPIQIDEQGAASTQGVAVVEHLYRLGRNDLGKRRKPGSFLTSRLQVCSARDGVDRRELSAIRRSQEFAEVRNRPSIIAQSISQWRKAR